MGRKLYAGYSLDSLDRYSDDFMKKEEDGKIENNTKGKV